MSQPSADIPLVPLVASLLRRLEYSPNSHPFYGRLALFDEATKPTFAKALHPRALWHALPDQPRRLSKCTMETEVARWSSEGDVEFRAWILPGCGFCRNPSPGQHGGLPASPDVSTVFTDFSLSGSLVVFVLGFNDYREDRQKVEDSMRHHADSYREKGCKVVFIEANDYHSTSVWWITEIAQRLAAEDPENIIFLPTTIWKPHDAQTNAQDEPELKFPFPDRGWASEVSDDSWHLTKQGLMKWLPVVKNVMTLLAEKHSCSKVLLVTDSTFQAHDYIQYECVIVRTGGGATTTFGISKSSTVWCLKTLIVESGFPRLGIRPEQLDLASSEDEAMAKNFLQDERPLAYYGIDDGVMLHVVVRDSLADIDRGVPGSSPLAFYLADNFCCEAQPIETGLYRVQLSGMEENSSWSSGAAHDTCYFGAGYRNGKTISEEGFGHRGNHNSGIYGSSDKNVALLYACKYEHKTPRGVTVFEAVLEGRVEAGKSQPCDNFDHRHVANKHDINVVALIVRVHCDLSSINGPACPPVPQKRIASPSRAVEVTPEVEHTSSQQSNADSTTAAPKEAPATAASSDPLRSQDMPSLTQKFQIRFKTSPEWGKIEMDPDDAQRFRTTASIPGEPPVHGEWARGKQEAKRVALVKLLSETPSAVETPTVGASSDSISQLNERYQKKFLESPKWEERSSTAVGKCRAAIRLPSGSVIEGPDCDSKQEAKIAALRQALEERA